MIDANGMGEETSYFKPHRSTVRINSHRLLERAKLGLPRGGISEEIQVVTAETSQTYEYVSNAKQLHDNLTSVTGCDILFFLNSSITHSIQNSVY